MEEDTEAEAADQTNEQDEALAKQLEKLNEYVQQMAYRVTEPPKSSELIDRIAKPTRKLIVSVYEDFKDTLKPKERSERVGRIVEEGKPMTIENFEEFIRQYRRKQIRLEKIKKQQQVKYHETLTKLQKQCENQLMNVIVEKFSKMVSKKACIAASTSSANVETESYQCLRNAIVCNMIFALDVPNSRQAKDVSVYQKLAAVLADLIIQVLFLARNSEGKTCPKEVEEEKSPIPSKEDEIIKLRALRAAKKKTRPNRMLRFGNDCADLSHRSFR